LRQQGNKQVGHVPVFGWWASQQKERERGGRKLEPQRQEGKESEGKEMKLNKLRVAFDGQNRIWAYEANGAGKAMVQKDITPAVFSSVIAFLGKHGSVRFDGQKDGETKHFALIISEIPAEQIAKEKEAKDAAVEQGAGEQAAPSDDAKVPDGVRPDISA